MLRSMIHLDLTFVQDDKYGFIYILLYVDIVRPAPFVEDALPVSLYGFGFFVKNQVFVGYEFISVSLI